mgnify:CR=1 FL=1
MPLVLKRSLGQGIKIGDSVYVEVHKISRKAVSLRVTAPQDVKILRFELPPLAKRVRTNL